MFSINNFFVCKLWIPMAILKYWRLNWFLNQIFTFSNFRKQRQVLVSSWKYWFALLVKLIPGLHKASIRLTLKEGGTFVVSDFMSLYIYTEIFIDKSYDYPDLGIENPTILDIGANTGLFTLRMKELYKRATVYCYEPFLLNYEQLSQNIQLSGLQDVEIINKGVGGSPRSEKLFINKNNLGGHSLFEMEARSDNFVNIEILGITELLNDLPQSHINLIKMDCEGAEYEIIKALDISSASKIEIIIFESTESVYNLDELLDHLKAIGFSIEFKEHSCNYIARNLKFDKQSVEVN